MGYNEARRPIRYSRCENLPGMNERAVYQAYGDGMPSNHCPVSGQRQSQEMLLVSVAQMSNTLKGILRACHGRRRTMLSATEFKHGQKHGGPSIMDAIQAAKSVQIGARILIQNLKQGSSQRGQTFPPATPSQDEH